MKKKILCLVLAVILAFGGGINALATSSSEVQKQQTETKNKLNKINKEISDIESKKKSSTCTVKHAE